MTEDRFEPQETQRKGHTEDSDVEGHVFAAEEIGDEAGRKGRKGRTAGDEDASELARKGRKG
jgi:hypothetical protein